MKYVFKNPLRRIIAAILDIVGSIIFFPVKLPKAPPPAPKNILVVRMDHIGDFICTSPVFSNLKKKFPQAKITALVNSVSKELAYANPNIDKVITFSPSYLARGDGSSTMGGLFRVIKDVRNIGFDLGLDPRGDLVSILIMWFGGVNYRAGYGVTGGGFLLNKECRYNENIHVIDRNLEPLKAIGLPIIDEAAEVYFNKKDMEAVDGLLPAPAKAVVLHPFAGTRSKEWPLGRFLKLAHELKEGGFSTIIVGSSKDHGAFEDAMDFRGKINLPQLAYLIKKAGLFIGLDSGPANMAAALNVPSVMICSGTNIPQLWIPDDGNVRFIYRDTPCKPCGLKTCRMERHECMESISVDDVMKAVNEIASSATATMADSQ
jgi:ADP-heptose:LPS heptosyltransferase